MQRLLQHAGEGDEVLHAETFRTEVEDRIRKEGGSLSIIPVFSGSLGGDNGTQGVAHGLPPLVERSLDDGLEKTLIASEICP